MRHDLRGAASQRRQTRTALIGQTATVLRDFLTSQQPRRRQIEPGKVRPKAIEKLCFLAKVERGLQQANAGKTVSHDEVKERLLG